jgi:hypothetical protein
MNTKQTQSVLDSALEELKEAQQNVLKARAAHELACANSLPEGFTIGISVNGVATLRYKDKLIRSDTNVNYEFLKNRAYEYYYFARDAGFVE